MASSEIKLEVNGQPFTLWESVNISRSIDSNCGTFSFNDSSTLPLDYPVKKGDYVRATINNHPIVTGYVDEIRASGDVSSHTITVSGRDNVQDLIDSSTPASVRNLDGNITMRELCERVISALGLQIKVIDNTGLENRIEDSQIDETDGVACMDFLTGYARKLQVYLVADGTGKLTIFRPGGQVAVTPLVHSANDIRNNVKKWDGKTSDQGRYNEYICRSQDNFGSDENADYSGDGTDRFGSLKDSSVRRGRLLEIKAEESMNDSECLKRANEEANLRRARATAYTAEIQDATMQNGVPWRIGDRVQVRDTFFGLSGEFLIRSTTFTKSVTGGTNCSVTVAPVDAYTVQGTETPKNKRLAQNSPQISRSTAQNVIRRSR